MTFFYIPAVLNVNFVVMLKKAVTDTRTKMDIIVYICIIVDVVN